MFSILFLAHINYFISHIEAHEEKICSQKPFLEFVECDSKNAITSFKLTSINRKIKWKNLSGKIKINFATNSMKDAMKLKKCVLISYFSDNINRGHEIVSIESKFENNIPTGAYINQLNRLTTENCFGRDLKAGKICNF